MTPTIAFLTILFLVLPQWVLMIVRPNGKWTQQLVDSDIIPFLLLVVYVTCIAKYGDHLVFESIPDLLQIFYIDNIVLGAWAFMGFISLLIGSWFFNKIQESEIAYNWVLPSLLTIFIISPIMIGAIIN